METASTTTWRALDPRVAASVAALPADDPIVRANALIDEANEALAARDYDKADHLFEVAEALIAGEEF